MSQIAFQIFSINLTTAGMQPFVQQVGLVHVLEFQDVNGDPVLTGKIECAIGEGANQWAPLRYNGKIALPETVSRATLRWAAQAGVYAIVLFSPDPKLLVADTPPTRQLVTSSAGGTLAAAAVTVGTSAAVVSAASTARYSATIQNLGSADIYVGPSGVTTSSGIKVPPGGVLTLDKQTAAIYAISGSAGNDVRVLTEST